ncbi:RhoGEF domain-containing protein [Entamoeba marina]
MQPIQPPPPPSLPPRPKRLEQIYRKHSSFSAPLETSPVHPNSKRERIVKEIYDTEVSYVTSLRTCEVCYHQKMLQSPSPFKIDDVQSIFNSFDQILQCNQEFITLLVTAMKQDQLDSTIGQIFFKFTPFFIVYKNFLINHDASSSLLSKLEEENKIQNYLTTLQNSITLPQKLDLHDYLIMPVQRLPRYTLLLAELLKNTPEDHCDYNNIRCALDVMKDVASKVNSSIAINVRQAQLVDLRDKIIRCGNFELVQPHRTFIMEKNFNQVTHASISKRVGLLFNDCFLSCSKEDKSLVLKHVFNLARCSIIQTDKPNMFQFFSDIKSFWVIVDSSEVKTEWVNALNQAVDKVAKKADFIFSPLVVNVNDVVDCASCKGVFYKKSKKFYCKKCVKFFCSKCFNNKTKKCYGCSPSESDSSKSMKKIAMVKPDQVSSLINLDFLQNEQTEEQNSSQTDEQYFLSDNTDALLSPRNRNQSKTDLDKNALLAINQLNNTNTSSPDFYQTNPCNSAESIELSGSISTENDSVLRSAPLIVAQSPLQLNEVYIEDYYVESENIKEDSKDAPSGNLTDDTNENKGFGEKVVDDGNGVKDSDSSIKEENDSTPLKQTQLSENQKLDSKESNNSPIQSSQHQNPLNTKENFSKIPDGVGRVMYLKSMNEQRIQQEVEMIQSQEMKRKQTSTSVHIK